MTHLASIMSSFFGTSLLFCSFVAAAFCIFSQAGQGRRAFFFHTVFLLGALGFLSVLFLGQDHSIALVAASTHPGEPTLYRGIGALGTYEGSLLFFSALVACYGLAYKIIAPPGDTGYELHIQAFCNALLVLFLLLLANPFRAAPPGSASSGSFNSLLEDPAISFHPPLLYLGYTGFSIVFSLTVSALFFEKDMRRWAVRVQPWALLAWGLLTLGTTAGAWWAYYQLGWGGFWSWDPTENMSLMPWIAGISLIHILKITTAAPRALKLAALTAVVCFLLALVGTFLVRTGLLFSIHAFARGSPQGMALMLAFYVVICLGLGAFLWRLPQAWVPQQQEGQPMAVSPWRQGALGTAFILMVTCLVSVAAGTFWPIVSEALGWGRVSVGGPFFVVTFVPFVLLLALLLPFGLFSRPKLVLSALWAPILAALLLALIIFPSVGMQALAFLASFWVLTGSLTDAFKNLPRASNPLPVLVRVGAHAGFGLLLLGATTATYWSHQVNAQMREGGKIPFVGKEFTLAKVREERGADYRALTFFIEDEDGRLLTPRIKYFPASGQVVNQTALLAQGLSQIYVAASINEESSSYLLRFSYFRLVTLLWIGGVFMGCAGLVSFGGRMLLWLR